MRQSNRKIEAGFTLVELLMVVAIMGLVITSVMGLYLNMQKTTGGAEETVEVQSGLRVGLDWMARDLRMAGFLIVGDIFKNAQSNTFTVNTSSAYNAYARIGADIAIPAAAAGDNLLPITISPPAMLDMFKNPGEYVRIMRPSSSVQPAPVTFRFVGKTATTITLEPDPDSFPGASYIAGDMLVRVQPPGDLTFPHTTTYYLEDDPDSADPAMRRLVRRGVRDDSTTWEERITGKITQLNFSYILEDGSTIAAVPAADIKKIVAVRITITGATDATKTGQANYAGVKTRELETIVKLRNL